MIKLSVSVRKDPFSGLPKPLAQYIAQRERELWDLAVATIESMQVDTAAGPDLDQLVQLTGTARQGRTDAEMRYIAMGVLSPEEVRDTFKRKYQAQLEGA